VCVCVFAYVIYYPTRRRKYNRRNNVSFLHVLKRHFGTVVLYAQCIVVTPNTDDCPTVWSARTNNTREESGLCVRKKWLNASIRVHKSVGTRFGSPSGRFDVLKFVSSRVAFY